MCRGPGCRRCLCPRSACVSEFGCRDPPRERTRPTRTDGRGRFVTPEPGAPPGCPPSLAVEGKSRERARGGPVTWCRRGPSRWRPLVGEPGLGRSSPRSPVPRSSPEPELRVHLSRRDPPEDGEVPVPEGPCPRGMGSFSQPEYPVPVLGVYRYGATRLSPRSTPAARDVRVSPRQREAPGPKADRPWWGPSRRGAEGRTVTGEPSGYCSSTCNTGDGRSLVGTQCRRGSWPECRAGDGTWSGDGTTTPPSLPAGGTGDEVRGVGVDLGRPSFGPGPPTSAGEGSTFVRGPADHPGLEPDLNSGSARSP